LDTVPDIIYLLDTEFRLVRWNRTVETLTGRTPQDLLGIPATDLLHPDDRKGALAAIARCLQVGRAEAELRMLDKDGRAIPYYFNGAVRRDAPGTVLGIAGVGSDISEHKEMEA
jgi:PAS domain S-box-containing protein